jgi:hypothetical protein
MCSFVSATAFKNASFVIVLSAGGVGGAVSDIDTSPNGNVGAEDGCSALTRSCRHRSPSSSDASTSPPKTVVSTQCTAYTCFVAWSNTTTSRYRPRHRSGNARSSVGASPNGSLFRY